MTRKNPWALRALSLILAAAMAVPCLPLPGRAAEEDKRPYSEPSVGASGSRLGSYGAYREGIGEVPPAQGEIVLEAATYAEGTGTVTAQADGSLLTGSDSTVTWRFQVASPGFYQLRVDYFPTVSKGGSIERTLLIDGEAPFEEARYIEFPRVYVDGEITKNARDNEVTPEQIEQPERMLYTLHDANGFVSEDLAIFLSAGEHSLSLVANKELLQLYSLKLYPEQARPSYAEYLESAGEDQTTGQTKTICVEAERPLKKSSFTIYPSSDKSSAATYPQHPVKTRLNVISGDKWSRPGQTITWEVKVETGGYYKIAPRMKQDAYSGGFVSRKLYIDGVCPFEEAAALRFDYAGSWEVMPLGGDSPYLFYLTEGTHTISMEVVLGDMAEIVAQVQNALNALNVDYRRILMITGPAPDIYRTYDFETLIPDVLTDLQVQAAALSRAVDILHEKTNVSGDFTNSINKLIIILDQIKEDPEMISELFATYKDNLSSLGTWLQNVMAQPLDVDRIYIVPAEKELPGSGDSFFANLIFQIKRFFLSFFEDYQSLASDITKQDYEDGKVITVWMTSGREQGQIMQRLTEQYFTPETGLKVNIQIVSADALLPSTLAGTGPDVVMNVGSNVPIDFAIRGAAVDLSEMPGFDEVCERFHPAALTPFSFDGSVYAIPETMTFLMMFYRTDIFEELSLEVPRTWDEFNEVVWELQQQKLDVGFPVNAKTSVASNMNLYGLELFLYQKGGTLYNEQMTASTLSGDLGVSCFEQMSELFTLYKFPVDYDFANRFRSGEMPMGIMEYPMYNQLTIFASEIKGQWAMAPVPGTVLEDGTVNNTSPAASSGIMMLKNARDYGQAWQFMEWVTRAETQSRYATEVESVLGVAAKQATANLEAMEGMSWTDAEYAALKAQIGALQGTPEIPGGYYTVRAIDFAFANVYTAGKDPATALLSQVQMLNDEITRKRKEFHLD